MPGVGVSVGRLPPGKELDFLRQKLAVPASHWTDLWQEAHSRAFAVAGAATQDIAEDFHKAILKVAAAGGTRADFRKSFDAIKQRYGWEHVGSPGWRSNIIYDTNMAMAYSAGRYRRQTTPEALTIYPYWRYRHHTCQHPRPQHVAWDGMILRADDPWWDTHYPPNGWRCHCTVEMVLEREMIRKGWSLSEAPVIETRPWRNPRTGVIVHVPVGIDPGFAYNPGKVWAEAEAGRAGRPVQVPRLELPGLKPEPRPVPVPVPGGVPKPVPAMPRVPGPEPGVAPSPVPDVTPPVSPAVQPVVPSGADHLRQGEIERLRKNPVGEVEAGFLPHDVTEHLGSETSAVTLSGETMEKQLHHHPDLTAEDYAVIPEALANSDIVASQGGGRVLLFRHVGRWYRLALKATKDGRENYLVSFHRTKAGPARRILAKLRLLKGNLDDLERKED